MDASSNLKISNPLVVIESHPECRKDGKGNKLLPDGTSTARVDLLMKPYISQLLGEASKQAEILAGDKAKVARQQRMQRMQPQRPANQVFPIYLNNLFQGRDPGKEKLADEDDITEYEQRLEDIRQAKKDAKDFGYADPYPDTEELATKGTQAHEIRLDTWHTQARNSMASSGKRRSR